MEKLKAILAARAEEEREAELHKIAGGRQAQVGWGSQIRSYVLQPYQLVKDLRTDHEVGNVRACSTATSTASWRPTCAGSAPRSGAER